MERENAEINPLEESYGRYIERIDRALSDELALYEESEFIGPLKYSLGGGKRIRPVILVLAAECVGGVDENTLAASCAVEFLHMESIIHDDIIDNETVRRQKDPFHIKYGYNTSILTGDFVLGLILAICSRLDNSRVTKDLATTAMRMSGMESTMSVRRIRMASASPPRNPAIRPMVVPMLPATRIAMMETIKEGRVP